MFKFELYNEVEGSLTLPSSPVNWDSINAQLERSPSLWAVNREVGSSELKFYGEAYDYIKSILIGQFVDAVIEMKVYYSSDLKIGDWKLLKQYNLTFHNCTDDGYTISAQINSGEIESIFEANLDTTFEVEMDDSITVKPVRLRRTATYERNVRSIRTYPGTIPADNKLQVFIHDMNLTENNYKFSRQQSFKDSIILSGGDDQIGRRYVGTWAELDKLKNNKVGQILTASEPMLIAGTVRYAYQVVIEDLYHPLTSVNTFLQKLNEAIGLNVSDLNNMMKFTIWTNSDNYTTQAQDSNYAIEFDLTFPDTIKRITCNFFFDFEYSNLEMNTGDVLFQHAFTTFDSHGEYTQSGFANDSEFNMVRAQLNTLENGRITYLLTLLGKDVKIPAISAGAAFQQITDKMLDADNTFQSRWFHQNKALGSGNYRSGKTDYLTTGKAFRWKASDETNKNKLLSITLKDLFDSLNNIYCLGMNISQTNKVKTVEVETRDWYFQLEYGGHIGDVADFEEVLADDLIYKNIDFQNQQIKEEEYSNRFAFNVPYSYKLPIDFINNAIDLTTAVSTSAITLELARRAAEVDDESDFDDKIFLTKCNNDKETLRKEVTINYSGIPDETYLANQDYCPAHTLRYYWGWWLAGNLQYVKGKKITLERNDFNRDFVSTRFGLNEINAEEINTAGGFSVGTILGDDRYSSHGVRPSLPHHEPFYHRFKAKMTYDLSKQLELYRNRIFSYDTAHGRMYGFISSVPTIPDREAEFEMIKASKYAISVIL